MIKIYSVIFLLLFVFGSCGKKSDNTDSTLKQPVEQKKEVPVQKDPSETENKINPENILGVWIKSNDKMGFELYSDGRAVSVEMDSDQYNKWELIENKLMFNSTGKGVKNPVTTTEIYIIREIYPDSIIISPSNYPETKWTYIKK